MTKFYFLSLLPESESAKLVIMVVMVMIIFVVMLVMVINDDSSFSSGQTGKPGQTRQTGQREQTDLTFKLDFSGNLCRAAFFCVLLCLVLCCWMVVCVFCIVLSIVFSVSCVGRVTNLLALFTLIYPPSLCATLSVYRIFVCACNHV